MSCPYCHSTTTAARKPRTALGYKTFCCVTCRRRFNERTGSPFNDLQFPTDIVVLAVLWRLRYKLGLRDVAELLLQRGFEVSYETVRAWEFRFVPMSVIVSGPDVAGRRGAPGTWTKRTSKLAAAGATCTAPSTEMGIFWIPCSAGTVIGTLPGASCAAWSMARATSHCV